MGSSIAEFPFFTNKNTKTDEKNADIDTPYDILCHRL